MDYGTAISRIVPGTFVPDLGNSVSPSEAPTVTPIPGIGAASATSSSTPSFKDTLAQAIADVNDKLNTAGQGARDLADGKTNDDTKVVESTEEANLALSYLTAVRSKLITAYQQVEQMQI
jgi:flagellar hook-basal body complex protein FliE